jgi:hypothetical protein
MVKFSLDGYPQRHTVAKTRNNKAKPSGAVSAIVPLQLPLPALLIRISATAAPG